MNVISVNNLSKSYGPILALKGISFNVPKGSIFGFLGPNGAGKTTTIGILMQFLHQDSGEVQIFGEDIQTNTKQRIGYIPDADLPEIKGLQLLKHSGRYYGLNGQSLKKRINEIIKITDSDSFIKRNTKNLSKGQKARIKIANALMGDPELLIADEPTAGLDPVSRRHFLDLIKHLVHKQNKTIFLSSHVISEVEKVCTDLLILSKGTITVQGTIDDIMGHLPVSNRYLVAIDGVTTKILSNLSGVVEVEEELKGKYVIMTDNGGNTNPEFIKEIINSNYKLNYFSRDKVTLEDIFFKVVNTND
ncbi:MAG: ATP-binding cassette domain-containing protein [Candidatus Hodarchaeales archaeon]